MKKMYTILLAVLCLGTFQHSFAQTKEYTFDQLSRYDYYSDMISALKEPQNVYKLWLRVDGATLPAEISKLTNLQIISLAGNPRNLNWKNTVAQLSKMPNLRYVFLFDSFMTTIPAEILTMKQLKGFGISNAALKKVPAGIAQLSNLEYLFLDDNKLTALPVEITQLKKLKMLVLDYNNISVFPPQMLTMKNLQELRIVDNPVKAEELTKLKKALPNMKVVEEYNFSKQLQE